MKQWRDLHGNYYYPDEMETSYIEKCLASCRQRNWQEWAKIFENELAARKAKELEAELDNELNAKIRDAR